MVYWLVEVACKEEGGETGGRWLIDRSNELPKHK